MALETSTHSRINEGEEANVRRSSLVAERYAVVRSSRWFILSFRSVVQPSWTLDDGKMSNGHMRGKDLEVRVAADTAILAQTSSQPSGPVLVLVSAKVEKPTCAKLSFHVGYGVPLRHHLKCGESSSRDLEYCSIPSMYL